MCQGLEMKKIFVHCVCFRTLGVWRAFIIQRAQLTRTDRHARGQHDIVDLLDSFNPFTAPDCKISGLKDAGLCLQTVHFPSYNICLQCYRFWWQSFHMTVQKRKQNGLRVSNSALLLVVLKWHHGSKGVKGGLKRAVPLCHSPISSECPSIYQQWMLAGEFSSPGSTFCADSYFGIRSTPVLP